MAAVTVRGTTIASRSINAGTRNVVVPAGTANGDVIYAFVSFGTNGSITVPTGWTLVPGTSVTNGFGTSAVYRKVWLTGDATTYAWVLAVSGGTVYWIVDYIGLIGEDTTTFEDCTVGLSQVSSGTAHAMPAQSIAASTGALTLYVLTGLQASGTAATGPGMTALGNGFYFSALSLPSTAPGVVAGPTVTSGTSDGTSTIAYALTARPAGALVYQYGPTSAATAPALNPGGAHVVGPDGVLRPERRPQPPARPRTSLLAGPNILSRCKHYPNETASVAQHNSRSVHTALFTGYDTRFHFGNVKGVELSGAVAFTLTASLERIAAGGDGSASQASSTIEPLTFGGQPSVVVQPGTYVRTDPLHGRLVKGQRYFIRTYRVPVGGPGIMPVSRVVTQDTVMFEGSDTSTASDLTLSGTVSGNAIGTYGPQYAEATPFGNAPTLMVVGTGDSIMEGAVGRTSLYGWFDQALELAGVPHMKLSMSGEQAVQFWGAGNNQPTYDIGRKYRGRYLSGATDVIDEYGSNDFNSAATLANMQSRSLVAANLCVSLGSRYHRTTITPKTTSTDSWATTTNQAAAFSTQVEADRRAFNAWLLDGAPLLANGSAAATGSSAAGTYRIGTIGHPIYGVFDAAGTVEVLNGSTGVWVPNALTTDGWHPGDSGINMIASALATYISTKLALVQ